MICCPLTLRLWNGLSTAEIEARSGLICCEVGVIATVDKNKII